MTSTSKNKKKKIVKDHDPKFIAEQNYTDQGLTLEDADLERPIFIEEEGITTSKDTEDKNPENGNED